ncbi:hypothetical protein BJ085DRAFT_33615 [Dimargaris cristalligena]|uniref:Uncharacterized protein n=1 Tax=Dimargaris cristalligena TaxID=215637 RepID=A0A4P9ZL81_9FUNG|nr:hypothetical protein BJ085DRAFT_33615 [Dimargaris cristalligena]|eukprot:RKP33865.1 hypothetical protein BJ085DRAFT_33615 [Dimargaris cristalligena]
MLNHASPPQGNPANARRSPPHVLFIVDTAALHRATNYPTQTPTASPTPLATALVDTVSRVLLHLHAQVDDRLTWATRWVDLTTGQGIRTNSRYEFQPLTAASIAEFEQYCRQGYRSPETVDTGSASGPGGSSLRHLRNLLTHVETDYAWSSLTFSVFSPTKFNSAPASDAQPDIPIPVKNYIYIISEAPRSLADLRWWVNGTHGAGQPSSDNPDSKYYAAFRNNLMGCGIWQNYLKKRIAVGWLDTRPTPSMGSLPVQRFFEQIWECFSGQVVGVPQFQLLANVNPCEGWLQPWIPNFIYRRVGANFLTQPLPVPPDSPHDQSAASSPVQFRLDQQCIPQPGKSGTLKTAQAFPSDSPLDSLYGWLTPLADQISSDHPPITSSPSDWRVHNLNVFYYADPRKGMAQHLFLKLQTCFSISGPVATTTPSGYNCSPLLAWWFHQLHADKSFALVSMPPPSTDSPSEADPADTSPAPPEPRTAILLPIAPEVLALCLFDPDVRPHRLHQWISATYAPPVSPTNLIFKGPEPCPSRPTNFSWNLLNQNQLAHPVLVRPFSSPELPSEAGPTPRLDVDLNPSWCHLIYGIIPSFRSKCSDSTEVSTSHYLDSVFSRDTSPTDPALLSPFEADTPNTVAESNDAGIVPAVESCSPPTISPTDPTESATLIRKQYWQSLFDFGTPLSGLIDMFSAFFAIPNAERPLAVHRVALDELLILSRTLNQLESKYQQVSQVLANHRHPTQRVDSEQVSVRLSASDLIDGTELAKWIELSQTHTTSLADNRPSLVNPGPGLTTDDQSGAPQIGSGPVLEDTQFVNADPTPTHHTTSFDKLLERFKLRECQIQAVIHLLYLRIYRCRPRPPSESPALTTVEAPLSPRGPHSGTPEDCTAIRELPALTRPPSDPATPSADREQARILSQQLTTYVDKLCIWSMVGHHSDLLMYPSGTPGERWREMVH